MRLSHVATATMFAGDALLTTAECAIEPGDGNATTLVGIERDAAKSVLAHMRCAMRASGFEWPPGNVTLNLSPAAVTRRSCSTGLPLALAVLVASEQVDKAAIEDRLFLGELMLSGETVAPSSAVAREVTKLAQEKNLTPVLPKGSHSDTNVALEVESLKQATATTPRKNSPAKPLSDDTSRRLDFSDLQGHIVVKKAAELAILTHTPLLLRTRQPELADTVACRMASLVGQDAPLRAPHHSADPRAISGGGDPHAPGEVDLARGGVLYLADLDRFSDEQLAPIADALENNEDFILVASAKPCPCGNLGDIHHPCTCTTSQITRWKSHLEGPLKGMFGLLVDVADPNDAAIAMDSPSLSSDQMARRMDAAREMSANRTGPNKGTWTRQADDMFSDLAMRLGMDSHEREVARMLSRATADLHGSTHVTTDHVTEAIALQHRLI